VQAAAAAGVELLALSDHDSVDGVDEAARAAHRAGLALVPAVEITSIDGERADLHVLGYRLDVHDSRLLERLAGFRRQREGRAAQIVEAVRGLGFEVDESILEARAAAGQSIGRPHLAQAVVAHPANAPRLRDEERSDPTAFLVGYLVEGRPAFVPRQGPSVAQAIATIHDAGGVAVWAHPFWDIEHPDDVLASIDRFRADGLDGVECFYATHTREHAELLADRCEQLDLLTTGSADFHGPEHRNFSAFRAFSTFGREPRLGPIADGAR
jgi:predicted metal-dependent phosphoesterase TrpH